jgi:uncharacterized integral membrane protein
MQRLANWLLWIVVMLTVVLAGLNWTTLTSPAPIDLLLVRIDAPLGIIMLGLTGALVLLFFVATLRNQIASLMETNRQQKEIRRLQGIEDGANSREIAALRELMQSQFDRLNQRLDGSRSSAESPEATKAPL